MKNSFPGYFPPTTREIEDLWENCLFTLDTNILLNLYRYSDSTRKEILQILHAMKDRLWLPHRAAKEYFFNRLGVISQQEKAYEDAIKTIETFQGDLSNSRQHPFLTENLMAKLTEVLKEVTSELRVNKNVHAKRTHADEIQQAISELFDGRVGPSYSEAQLDDICKEGDERYNRKTPPGYKDDGKNETASPGLAKYRRFGDLIIWKQILEKSNEAGKGIIFVNDDKKEDWWLIFRGKTLGPRPELVDEFLASCNQSFYMYQADRFFELAAKHVKQAINPASVSEIRDLIKSDIELQKRLSMAINEVEMLQLRVAENQSKTAKTVFELDFLVKQAEEFAQRKKVLSGIISESKVPNQENLARLEDLYQQSEVIEMQIHKLRSDLAVLEREQEMNQRKLSDLDRFVRVAPFQKAVSVSRNIVSGAHHG